MENLGKLEIRRFSNATFDEIPSVKLHAALNLNTLMSYLSMSLSDQLRYLTLAIRRYMPTHAEDKELVANIDNYLSSELARIITRAKAQISVSGGNINTILKFSKYGPEVISLALKLNKSLVKANNFQKKGGFIPKNIQEEIQLNFGQLVDKFRQEFIYGNLTGKLVLEETVSMSRKFANISIENSITIEKSEDIQSLITLLKDNYLGEIDIAVNNSTNAILIGFFNGEINDNILNNIKEELVINKFKIKY